MVVALQRIDRARGAWRYAQCDRAAGAVVAHLATVPDALVAELTAGGHDVAALGPAALRELADDLHCALIVTTGGTGPSPRDVTPEATVAVCDRLLPGFGEQMRAVSVRTVPTAILSRQVAGTRGNSLIINLPGKPAAIEECLGAVWAAVPYCMDLIGGPRLLFSAQAPAPFRPTSA